MDLIVNLVGGYVVVAMLVTVVVGVMAYSAQGWLGDCLRMGAAWPYYLYKILV